MLRGKNGYFRLCNTASGPETVDVGGLDGPLLPQKEGGGRADPQKSKISGPEALLRNLK